MEQAASVSNRQRSMALAQGSAFLGEGWPFFMFASAAWLRSVDASRRASAQPSSTPSPLASL